MKFNEEDKKNFIDFLNMIAKHGKFELSTAELIQYFKLLSHMQQKMLPKIEANVLEVKKIVHSNQESSDQNKE